ncbi:hypothetical protein F4775DRAFT_588357 [Biscogniauxia sp. FL1348]|nr:hypothetical protein F4775DRAFT_588357 [Biscogniauxia sp. FL1348]
MKSTTLLLPLLVGTLATAQADPETLPGHASISPPCLASATITVTGRQISDTSPGQITSSSSSSGATRTETLGGVTPSTTVTTTGSLAGSTPNGAVGGCGGGNGVGILAGVLGVVVIV